MGILGAWVYGDVQQAVELQHRADLCEHQETHEPGVEVGATRVYRARRRVSVRPVGT